tara:strand:- start:15377 stop:16585 length:1209 start_codon:yes stop_codon:yes gene_type:complete
MSLKKVAIVGAGVTGLTTAILLRLSGYDVHVFASKYPVIDHSNPFFASAFPAASIVPHSVTSPISKKLFLSSVTFYEKLFELNFSGIYRQIHYEVFSEASKSKPVYLQWLPGYTEIPLNGNSFIPHIPHYPLSRAWKFSMFFVDWPVYWKALLKIFTTLEISFTHEIIDFTRINSRFSAENYSLVVLASGSGLEKMYNKPLNLLKGHLLDIDDAPKLRNPDGDVFSYNYTPPLKVYSTMNGKPQDIYSYPRSGTMILGGSRIAGKLTGEKWKGDELLPNYKKTENNLEWPYSAIFELNKILIEHSTNSKIHNSQIKSKVHGYRYLGPNSSLCFKIDPSKKVPHIHAYGLGGAGVTLSWGLANEITSKANELLEATNDKNTFKSSSSIQAQNISRLLANLNIG